MTTTVVRVEIPSGAARVPYTALIDETGVLLRYTSVIDPAHHFDVLKVPPIGAPEWLGQWNVLWDRELRDALVNHLRSLAARER